MKKEKISNKFIKKIKKWTLNLGNCIKERDKFGEPIKLNY